MSNQTQEDAREARFIAVIVAGVFAFGLGFYLHVPEEPGYSLAEIAAMNELTANSPTRPDDWLSQVVAAKERMDHAQ